MDGDGVGVEVESYSYFLPHTHSVRSRLGSDWSSSFPWWSTDVQLSVLGRSCPNGRWCVDVNHIFWTSPFSSFSEVLGGSRPSTGSRTSPLPNTLRVQGVGQPHLDRPSGSSTGQPTRFCRTPRPWSSRQIHVQLGPDSTTRPSPFVSLSSLLLPPSVLS